MNNSGIKKSHKKLLIVLLVAFITAGGVFMFSMLRSLKKSVEIESMKLVWLKL